MRTPTHILLCLFLLFCSCGKEDEENYHKFTQDDYNYIPTVYKEEGKVRHFINQHNDTIKIENRSYFMLEKTPGGSFTGVFFYNDELRIKLRLLDFTPVKYINFEIFKKANGSLISIINIPKSEFCESYYRWDIPEDKQYLTELSINTTTYKNVAVLHIKPKNYEDGCYFFIADTVTPDKVYYSFKYGIIGFDDTKNNLSYRLKE